MILIAMIPAALLGAFMVAVGIAALMRLRAA
jgi:hypothetical protein